MSQAPQLPAVGFIREKQLLPFLPFRKTKLRQEIAAGRFPKPKSFGERCVAWDLAAVHAWIAQHQAA